VDGSCEAGLGPVRIFFLHVFFSVNVNHELNMSLPVFILTHQRLASRCRCGPHTAGTCCMHVRVVTFDQ